MQNTARPGSTGKSAYHSGSEGLWTFVFIDMVIFLLIFFVFMSDRMHHLALYQASQHQLDMVFGFANLVVLLTSSWMMVEAVHGARQGDPKSVSRYLGLALLLGLVFSVDKVVEYGLKFHHGITPATNPFFSFYFFITIAHFLHVIGGMIFMFHFRARAAECRTAPNYLTGLENVGLFWHYVDALWIFIFPLLYLVGLT